MAFLLSVARNLRSKLNTKPNYPFKVSSFPSFLRSDVRITSNISKNGNFFEQNRAFKVVVGERNDESGEEQEQVVELVPLEKWFWKFKEDYLDNPKYENAMDGYMRNAMRLTADQRTREFAALDSLLGKNLTWLQLVLVDDKRSIQGNLYSIAARVFPNSQYVAVNSRQLFREAAPFFLHDTEQWVFSRSFVFMFIAGDYAVEERGLSSRESRGSSDTSTRAQYCRGHT